MILVVDWLLKLNVRIMLSELTVEIVRNSGSPKEDKLVVCTKEAAADAKDAMAIFKAGEANDMQTVALHADAIRI
uniref:Uncharacterized protein n=1 Tax=Panagrolaimus superbus TaxID=310955 RepID=A0A914Y734_9BILA